MRVFFWGGVSVLGVGLILSPLRLLAAAARGGGDPSGMLSDFGHGDLPALPSRPLKKASALQKEAWYALSRLVLQMEKMDARRSDWLFAKSRRSLMEVFPQGIESLDQQARNVHSILGNLYSAFTRVYGRYQGTLDREGKISAPEIDSPEGEWLGAYTVLAHFVEANLENQVRSFVELVNAFNRLLSSQIGEGRESLLFWTLREGQLFPEMRGSRTPQGKRANGDLTFKVREIIQSRLDHVFSEFHELLGKRLKEELCCLDDRANVVRLAKSIETRQAGNTDVSGFRLEADLMAITLSDLHRSRSILMEEDPLFLSNSADFSSESVNERVHRWMAGLAMGLSEELSSISSGGGRGQIFRARWSERGLLRLVMSLSYSDLLLRSTQFYPGKGPFEISNAWTEMTKIKYLLFVSELMHNWQAQVEGESSEVLQKKGGFDFLAVTRTILENPSRLPQEMEIGDDISNDLKTKEVSAAVMWNDFLKIFRDRFSKIVNGIRATPRDVRSGRLTCAGVLHQ